MELKLVTMGWEVCVLMTGSFIGGYLAHRQAASWMLKTISKRQHDALKRLFGETNGTDSEDSDQA